MFFTFTNDAEYYPTVEEHISRSDFIEGISGRKNGFLYFDYNIEEDRVKIEQWARTAKPGDCLIHGEDKIFCHNEPEVIDV